MGLYKQKNSPNWSISYYVNGKQVRESTGTTKEREAKAILEAKIAEHRVKGTPVMAGKTTLIEILRLVQDDYIVNRRKSAMSVPYCTKRLVTYFQPDCKAKDITSATLTAYVQHQQGKGYASATINQDLAILRAFALAIEAQMVDKIPLIKKLKVSNARKGFFEIEQHRAVVVQLPGYLKALAEVAYPTGMRKSELLALQWRQVDFDGGWIRLEPGTTKNDEGRVIPFTPELRAVLEAQRRRVREIGIFPHVFVHFGMKHGKAADGSPIRSYRTAWANACVAAGYPGRFMHDYRRTQVRNLERAGVSRSAAMAITGHKTEAVYRRYAIVNDATLQDAGEKLSRLHAAQS